MPDPAPDTALDLQGSFRAVRAATRRLCEPLATEDYVVQSMPDVSPTRWHLAHVSWFFETFALKLHLPEYTPVHAEFEYLFNSYYNAVGGQFPRARRGLLTRPTVAEVHAYAHRIDERMEKLLEQGDLPDRLREIIELGLHHEQQHQELMLMDIKHVFSCNPLHPTYRESGRPASVSAPPQEWIDFPEGVRSVGHDGSGFAFDNERPRHRVLVPAFRIASRPVTGGEFLEFVEDGGYRRPELWLADGWTAVQAESWRSPHYWHRRDDEWLEFTLGGLRPLDRQAPVSHVSYFEADAFATWAGARLPGEFEWETAAADRRIEGNFVEEGVLHPVASVVADPGPAQLFGDVWEWTGSAYAPYPGFRAAEGALGEYNGKFMCSQQVLRGGACVTPRRHIRPTYRNFYYPHQRWQFSGIRLARDP